MEEIRCIAVDWSGAATGAERRLWLAEARGARLLRLEDGRGRDALVDHLVQLAREHERLVVGLDFAFAFPAWFAREHGALDGPGQWALAAREGERWLRECPPPFWGRKGTGRPAPEPRRPLFRRTESERLPLAGTGPKSVFQIAGSGAVGTGSLRGMPHLARLRAAGFAVWPFDPPAERMVVEIYPRWLTGRVVKRSETARRLYLGDRHPELARAHREAAARSEDAFDAAVSALAMARRPDELRALRGHEDATYRCEGRIWRPRIVE